MANWGAGTYRARATAFYIYKNNYQMKIQILVYTINIIFFVLLIYLKSLSAWMFHPTVQNYIYVEFKFVHSDTMHLMCAL